MSSSCRSRLRRLPLGLARTEPTPSSLPRRRSPSSMRSGTAVWSGSARRSGSRPDRAAARHPARECSGASLPRVGQNEAEGGLMADVNPIPEGYPRGTPYLYMDGAPEAIDFYWKVLGAKERMRLPGPDGKLGHAELEIGNSVVMLADQNLNMDIRGPKEIGGTPVSLHVYVEDVDAAYAAGLDAGATSLRQ